ncbi:MAP kinase kinase (MEK) [Rhodotorula kratochvilovae]
MSAPPAEGGLAPPSGLLARRAKNRNKMGLALSSEAAKPGTLAGSSAADLLQKPAAGPPPVPSRPQPIQVAGSSRSNRTSVVSADSTDGASPLLPTTPSLSSSSTSESAASARSSHNRFSEQLATLELGVEFKLDLRNEDLEVLEELGCGNGGTVSRALHVPTKAIMAKKVVHIATSDTTRKQILRELQIMHDCASPYIVSFYGAYLQDPHICMCMEFMDKGSLDNIYKKVGPIPEPILGKIALAVVCGLTYLYEVHKIMHRDVKPSNILLNSAGQIKICDFGVSGELINSVADTFVGTSTYMSPERISGDPYTVKSDVWSLGITLVELAIGRFPFSSSDEDDTPSSDEESAFARLSLAGVDEDGGEATYHQGGGGGADALLGDDTLSPAKPEKKRESIMLAERQRAAKRESLRARKASGGGGAARKATGVSLAGSGHQMSILELLQYIVNEPAPRLPAGRFDPIVEEFVDATLRKEPVGWNVKKKGPLPKEVARPTPKELLEYPWMRQAAAADTDVEAFARSIP